MNCELKALNIADGFEIYHLLQRIPKNENGFQNNINGVSYEDFKAWLVRKMTILPLFVLRCRTAVK